MRARPWAVLGMAAPPALNTISFATNIKGLSKVLRMVESSVDTANAVKQAHSRPMGDDMLPAFSPV